MKILQVINSLNTGGAEKLLLETIPLYVKKGIEMDLLLLNGNDYPFKEELENCNCCNVYSLGKGSVYNPFLIFKIIPYLKKYDLIHVHLFPAQYWVVFAKLISFSKVKLVFTEHNTTNNRLENSFFKWIDKFIYQFYFKIVCISKEVFSIIKNHSKLTNSKFSIIENGVNLGIIKDAVPIKKSIISQSIIESDKILLQVAGFRVQKDQSTLIKSILYLPENIKLLLVGDGPLKANCENLVKELGLETRVFFLGVRKDVPQLLKTADIVVLSSNYEGLSLSSIEGMASGKPFVASNVPGLKDIVEDAGVLFKQGDENELARCILDLLNDGKLYNKVAKSCLKRAEEFDISLMVKKHIELYSSIC